MPVEAVGEVIGAAVEIVADAVLDVPEPPKRGRLRRILYWSVIALISGSLLFVIYLALG
jgi:hypothetical protein